MQVSRVHVLRYEVSIVHTFVFATLYSPPPTVLVGDAEDHLHLSVFVGT